MSQSKICLISKTSEGNKGKEVEASPFPPTSKVAGDGGGNGPDLGGPSELRKKVESPSCSRRVACLICVCLLHGVIYNERELRSARCEFSGSHS